MNTRLYGENPFLALSIASKGTIMNTRLYGKNPFLAPNELWSCKQMYATLLTVRPKVNKEYQSFL